MTQKDEEKFERMNKEQAFLLYTTFCGDVERTAHAVGVRPVDILAVAGECGWDEKLKAILTLKRSAAPGDVERGINRAMNFVQAHRMRCFLDRVIDRLTSMNLKEINEYFLGDLPQMADRLPQKKDGMMPYDKRLATRALADLASALEKVQALSYRALQDTETARAQRNDAAGSGDSAGAIHAAIAEAMSAVGSESSPASLLFDAQLAVGQAQAAKVSPRLLVRVDPPSVSD